MNEFVYKLNLPPLLEILLDSAKDTLFNTKNNLAYFYVNTDCVKPEWLQFNNYNWNSILLFYKNNSSGLIHIDGKNSIDPLEQPTWGINWIHGGQGVMDYWNMEDVLPPTFNPNGPKDRIICHPMRESSRTYHMSEGAYLVNASFPHKASGNAGRYAFSLRDTTSTDSWDTVVNNFKQYII